ncbi:MAG TPA: tetratricopeptide repeat protein [Acidimicrobiales bacterium]|nr:tetratricopeptide repeat protein [Acidimicrobiales bacterium]
MGKTRLAVEVAAQHPAVAWLDLADGGPDTDVGAALAGVLGLPAEPDMDMVQALVAELGRAPALVVVDNAEHLVASVASLATAVVSASPRVKVLVTSRIPLHAPGELVWRVDPLGLPPEATTSAADIADVPSVRLFVERARSVRREFALDDGNAPAVADICRRLDGLPLAIHLAAGWVKVLDPHRIAERLAAGLDLLSADPGGPTRHRTMRMVLDSSYDLLNPDERFVFDRLTPFRGVTLEAAEAVGSGEGTPPGRVLGALAGLVDKSLLTTYEHGPRLRYRRLATVRQYAEERLSGLPHVEAARALHARWCLGLVEGVELDPATAETVAVEHDNLVAALGWSVAHDVELALRLLFAVRPFWLAAGRLQEGRRWAEAVMDAVAEAGSAGPDVLARGAEAAAELVLAHGHHPRLGAWLDLAGRHYSAAGDRTGQGRVRVLQGAAARLRGGLGEAARLLEEARADLEDGPEATLARCLAELGHVASLRGDDAGAEPFLRRALELFERSGDGEAAALVLRRLGKLAALRGDVAGARRLQEQALAIYRQGDRPLGMARTLADLAELAWRNGDFAGSEAQNEETLSLQRRLGDQWGEAKTLNNLGYIAYHRSDLPRSLRLYTEVLGLRRRLGDRRGEANALVGLANAVFLDESRPPDLDRARSLAEEGVDLLRQVGDTRNLAWALYTVGEICHDLGDPSAARAAAEESVALYRQLGDNAMTTLGLFSLATLDLEAGDLPGARALALEAGRMALALRLPLQQARCCELAARVALAVGNDSQAALLYGAARATREKIGAEPPRAAFRSVRDADTATLTRRLGRERFTRLWEEGGRLRIDQAQLLAVEEEAAPAPPVRAVPAAVVRLLGNPAVESPSGDKPLPATAPGRLLKLVALSTRVTVDEAVEVLWPDEAPGVGSRRLNNVLSRLRRDLGELVVRNGGSLGLAQGVEVDAVTFERRARAALAAADEGLPEAGSLCREALVSYGGELLPADRYEDWTAAPRERLANLYGRLLDTLADDALAGGRRGEAVEWLERAIDAEPLDEQRYLRAVRVLLDQGWRHRARSVALRAERVLSRGLGIPLPDELEELVRADR